jgi:hypothetical protein
MLLFTIFLTFIKVSANILKLVGDISVGIATSPRTKRSGFDFRQGQEIFLFSIFHNGSGAPSMDTESLSRG